MRTASLSPKNKPAAASGPDIYGYAPVRLADLDDGSRIALPSGKPDLAKLEAAGTVGKPGVAAADKRSMTAAVEARSAGTGTASKAVASPAADALAALRADVEERKATLIVMGHGKGDRIAPAAGTTAVAATPAAVTQVPAPKSSPRIAAAKDFVDPRKAVPAAISAVAHSAEAVRVAAIDTTAKAVDAVQERIGDTFKSRDTITGSTAIDRMIERSAAENNIPSELAYAVVRVESHYNPTAIGGGAYGLSQIKPATARGLGFAGPAKGLLEPETNLRYGMRYLAGAWEKSGHDICGTAMRYKGGHRTTTMTRAAAVYCSNVKRHMAAIERRRAPANRETLVAAAERQQQIALANRPVDMRARARFFPASVARPAEKTADPASLVTVAASTGSGQRVAASAATVRVANASPVATPAAPAARNGRVRVFTDTDAGAATPLASNVAATNGFAYAD